MTAADRLLLGVAKDLYNMGEFLNEIEQLTRPELSELMQEIKKLLHHKDTTVGLWATDIDPVVLFNSDDKEMFQITY